MSMHHIIRDSDLAATCAYCSKEMVNKAWTSHWVGEKHYKAARCECGREMWLRVMFIGSGHDNWNKNGANNEGKTIEERVTGAIKPAPRKF